MVVRHDGGTMFVSGLRQLASHDCGAVRSALWPELASGPQIIEFDLSQTEYMDCGGLGTLIALRNLARAQNGNATVHLIDPAAPIRRLLQVTKLEGEFSPACTVS